MGTYGFIIRLFQCFKVYLATFATFFVHSKLFNSIWYLLLFSFTKINIFLYILSPLFWDKRSHSPGWP